jgi:hypothetical protein
MNMKLGTALLMGAVLWAKLAKFREHYNHEQPHSALAD